MPDYTLCTNKDCPIKSECRRSVQNTEPSKYKQTYQCFEYEIDPAKDDSEWCEYFMPINEMPKNEEK